MQVKLSAVFNQLRDADIAKLAAILKYIGKPESLRLIGFRIALGDIPVRAASEVMQVDYGAISHAVLLANLRHCEDFGGEFDHPHDKPVAFLALASLPHSRKLAVPDEGL